MAVQATGVQIRSARTHVVKGRRNGGSSNIVEFIRRVTTVVKGRRNGGSSNTDVTELFSVFVVKGRRNGGSSNSVVHFVAET